MFTKSLIIQLLPPQLSNYKLKKKKKKKEEEERRENEGILIIPPPIVFIYLFIFRKSKYTIFLQLLANIYIFSMSFPLYGNRIFPFCTQNLKLWKNVTDKANLQIKFMSQHLPNSHMLRFFYDVYLIDFLRRPVFFLSDPTDLWSPPTTDHLHDNFDEQITTLQFNKRKKKSTLRIKKNNFLFIFFFLYTWYEHVWFFFFFWEKK